MSPDEEERQALKVIHGAVYDDNMNDGEDNDGAGPEGIYSMPTSIYF